MKCREIQDVPLRGRDGYGNLKKLERYLDSSFVFLCKKCVIKLRGLFYFRLFNRWEYLRGGGENAGRMG